MSANEDMMAYPTVEEIQKEIDAFQADVSTMSPQDCEKRFSAVLRMLLQPSGYDVIHVGGPHDGGVDVIAIHPDERILVQVKRRLAPRPEPVMTVRELVGTLVLRGANRGILFSTGKGFSKQAWVLARHDHAPDVELLDFDGLRDWAFRIQRSKEEDHSGIRAAVLDFSKKLARIIAQNRDAIDEIEWRDMERLLAEVFDGLGFDVQLTRPAKDGGRDIILQCSVSGQGQSYLVEVKHWTCRSRVSGKYLRHFVDVIARDGSDGGLFLSSYGYAGNAFEALTEVERERVKFGEGPKIASLCKTYVKAEMGIWEPDGPLPEILFLDTH